MSAFSAVAQEVYICLRCQYRIAANDVTPFRFGASRPKKTQRRGFTTQTQRLQEHVRADDSYIPGHALLENVAVSKSSINPEENDIQLPDDGGTPRNLRDSGYFFKRANLYSRDALGVTSLRKPAEVLCVQDRPPRSATAPRKWWLFQTKGDDNPSSHEPLTSSDILDRVNSERGLVSQAKANENIEGLKQEWLSGLKGQGVPPTGSECFDLGKRLHDGFTKKQLLGYLNREAVPDSTDLLDLNKPFHSIPLTRTDWRAGTTFFPGDAAHRIQSSVAGWKNEQGKPAHTEGSLTNESRNLKEPVKYTLVNKILRQNWNIKPREELQSIGEVDVRLRGTDLELMSSHSKFYAVMPGIVFLTGGYRKAILRQLAEEYDAKIDVAKDENILRFTANQATCVSSLKMLSMVLDDINVHEMDVDAINSADSGTANLHTSLNDALFREIERLSSTVIRWRKPFDPAMSSPRKVSCMVTITGAAANAMEGLNILHA